MPPSRVVEIHTGSLFPAERKMFETRLTGNLKDIEKSNLKYLFQIYLIKSYPSHPME